MILKTDLKRVKTLLKKKWKLKDVAKEFDCTIPQVQYFLRKSGIKRKKGSGRMFSKQQADVIIKSYIEVGYVETAKKFNIDKKVPYYIFKHYGGFDKYGSRHKWIRNCRYKFQRLAQGYFFRYRGKRSIDVTEMRKYKTPFGYYSLSQWVPFIKETDDILIITVNNRKMKHVSWISLLKNLKKEYSGTVIEKLLKMHVKIYKHIMKNSKIKE